MRTRQRFQTGVLWGLALLTINPAILPAVTGNPEASSSGSPVSMSPLPPVTKGGMDALFEFSKGHNPTFTPEATQLLVDFISRASATDSGWELPDRDGDAGSAYIVKIQVPLEQYLALNFHPGIPDYAVFPASLRYSACLNSNDMNCAYACIAAGPTGEQSYVSSRMTGMEEITPNPESGSYFAYTNSRTFLRCKVEGRDVLFSCSETLGPSTTSNRGVPIGPPGPALFYYSEKPGLNLTGMTWMLSRINRSTTLSVYIALNPHETAVATFAWLNAGWRGVNVTRACHILNSQKSTLDFSRRIAQHPGVSASRIASLVETVEDLPVDAINTEYERYLSYVRSWRDNDKKGLLLRGSLLQDLYDAKATQTIPLSHRRALLVQERVRTLLGMPTWSGSQSPSKIARR